MRPSVRTGGRSVDSECRSYVIQPRKAPQCGSLRRVASGGRVGVPLWPGCVDPTGVQEHGIDTTGFSRNLGDPAVPPPQTLAWSCQTLKLQGPRSASGRKGAKTDARGGYRQAKETKRGETGGRRSEHLIVPTKQANSVREEPVEGRGCHSKEPLAGNMASASKLGTVSTRQQRIAELAKELLRQRIRDGVLLRLIDNGVGLTDTCRSRSSTAH